MAAITKMEDQPFFKIEDEIESEMHTRYYLKPSLRSSNIPKEVELMIDHFGTIQNVNDDGNYGIYIITEGIYYNSIQSNKNVDIFRKGVYDYIDNNRKTVLAHLQFRQKIMVDGSIQPKQQYAQKP